jgi:hypothetical protein
VVKNFAPVEDAISYSQALGLCAYPTFESGYAVDRSRRRSRFGGTEPSRRSLLRPPDDGGARYAAEYERRCCDLAGGRSAGDRPAEAGWQVAVSRSCVLYLEERRLYRRKDGEIVKLRDDVLSAARYGMMMRRSFEPLDDCG